MQCLHLGKPQKVSAELPNCQPQPYHTPSVLGKPPPTPGFTQHCTPCSSVGKQVMYGVHHPQCTFLFQRLVVSGKTDRQINSKRDIRNQIKNRNRNQIVASNSISCLTSAWGEFLFCLPCAQNWVNPQVSAGVPNHRP